MFMTCVGFAKNLGIEPHAEVLCENDNSAWENATLYLFIEKKTHKPLNEHLFASITMQ